jgi:hypothetical protein
MIVFWVAAPRSLVTFTDVSDVPAALIITLMMEASKHLSSFSEFYQTTRRSNPEDSHLHAAVRRT